MSIESVTSAQNPKIKELLALQEKSRLRRERGLFVVEGRRELAHCVEAGFTVDTVFVCPEIFGDGAQFGKQAFLPLSGNASLTASPPADKPAAPTDGSGKEPRIVEVTPELYGKIAYRGGTEGIVAEVRVRERGLQDLVLPANPLLIVLESVEKPGNLGAVLRSADAAGADAVIVCDPLTDLYNPNLIRASLGGIFTVPCVATDSPSAIAWLKQRGIRILTAQLQDSVWYYDSDMTGGTAIVIGTESTGLTEQWREAADAHIRIPMLGRLDSLNASVSAAILLFEAVRQRQGRR